MKKFVIGCAVLCSCAFVSCKKDYTCDCTVTVSIPGFGGSSSETITYNMTKVKKKDAENRCDDYQSDAQSQLAGLGTATCDLKQK